jgi:hypothetical protein
VVAFWHLASLDAPTVAVVWSLAFAWAWQIHVTAQVMLVLALTVWCAYVCDRLLDARILDRRTGLDSPTGVIRTGLRERHYFHWRHRRLLTPLAAAAACIAGAAAMTLLPHLARARGLVLAASALVYFSGVHATPRAGQGRLVLFWPISKESLVAVLFAAGCILPAWPRFHASGAQEFSHVWFWIPAIYFAAVAWLNCRSIAKWESADEAGSSSFDHEGRAHFEGAGHRTNLKAALLIAFVGLLFGMIAGAWHPRVAALLTAGGVSALLLALLDGTRGRMTPLALRAAADLVLLIPLVILVR